MITEDVNKILQEKQTPTLFFCGIGGIGMSGLALLSKSCGYNVFGSNEEENKNTDFLQSQGIQVFIGHKAEHIKDIDIFVYTPAVDLNTNCESLEAKKQQIPIINRSGMLSILMKHYFNIVVAGSHGKTTTTAIIGHTLDKIGLKPNILVGGVLNSCHTNCHIEQSKYFVLESDESDGSFEGMPANIGVITNVDPEHMEFYHTTDKLEEYFYSFARKSFEKSGVVICIDDKIGIDIVEKLREKYTKQEQEEKLITYSFNSKKADLYAENIKLKENGLEFDIINTRTNKKIKNVFLANMFGEVNVSNVLASIGVGILLKQDEEKLAKTLENFVGIQKRFTILGKIKNNLIVDDYAHNPQKIAGAVGSSRHYAKCHHMDNNLIIVFEPHRYTRVRDGMKMFADSLKIANKLIVLPIYSSSEKPIEGIDDDYVFNELKKVNQNVYRCEDDAYKIRELLNKITTDEHGLIVFMGAGKSSKLAHNLVEYEEQNKK